MAYQIDFTAANYANRSRRKWFLRFLLLAAAVGAVWGACDVWKTYNEPTLNMRLAEYEAKARPVEEINAAWERTAKEYNETMRYYRLVGAVNPTNFLSSMAAPGAPRLGRGYRPRSWTLTTGGACSLDYRYVFSPGDKAEQARLIEAAVVGVVTSAVTVVADRVEVKGVQVENLLDVSELNIAVTFALPDAGSPLVNKGSLASSVKDIAAQRKRLHETGIAVGDARLASTKVQGLMVDYLPGTYGKDKATGAVRPDFPVMTNVLDVAGWFARADQFIAKYRIPEDARRRELKETWMKIGDARFPWQRFRALDNADLVQATKDLGAISDGVKPFKGVLDQYHAFCVEKLGAFIDAYDRQDVFNKPLVESDLKDRVARAVGIARVAVSFADAKDGNSVDLVKDAESFTFSWVRWTLSVGNGMGRDGAGGPAQEVAAEAEEPLTLDKLAACARKTLELGPGYVLDSIKVVFDADGRVSGAVLEGLLPVKKIESKKMEATKDVL